MRTILLIALFMNSYQLFAPDFDDGGCLAMHSWSEWVVVPLLLVTLFLDARAMVLRYKALQPWRIERQSYLRMRHWVVIHGEAKGRV